MLRTSLIEILTFPSAKLSNSSRRVTKKHINLITFYEPCYEDKMLMEFFGVVDISSS